MDLCQKLLPILNFDVILSLAPPPSHSYRNISPSKKISMSFMNPVVNNYTWYSKPLYFRFTVFTCVFTVISLYIHICSVLYLFIARLRWGPLMDEIFHLQPIPSCLGPFVWTLKSLWNSWIQLIGDCIDLYPGIQMKLRLTLGIPYTYRKKQKICGVKVGNKTIYITSDIG